MGGSTSTSTPTSTTSTNSLTTSAALGQQGAGTSNVGSSQVNLEATGSQGNSYTFNSQSPEALAAAGQAIQSALQLAETATQSSLGFASQEATGAQQLASGNTGTAANQLGGVLKIAGFIIVAGLLVYFYFRNK